jgi:hypothetical protein
MEGAEKKRRDKRERTKFVRPAKRKPAHALTPFVGVSDPLQKARTPGFICEGGLEGEEGNSTSTERKVKCDGMHGPALPACERNLRWARLAMAAAHSRAKLIGRTPPRFTRRKSGSARRSALKRRLRKRSAPAPRKRSARKRSAPKRSARPAPRHSQHERQTSTGGQTYTGEGEREFSVHHELAGRDRDWVGTEFSAKKVFKQI